MEEVLFLENMASLVQNGEHLGVVISSKTFEDVCFSLSACQWFILGPSLEEEYAIIFYSGSNLYFFDVGSECLVDFEIITDCCQIKNSEVLKVTDMLHSANIGDFTIKTSGGLDESRLRVLLGGCNSVKVLVPTQENLRGECAVMAFSNDYLFMIDPGQLELHYLQVKRNTSKPKGKSA